MGLKAVRRTFNGDERVVNELYHSKKPILIYGCANHAELVYEFLKKNDLEAEAFIVDSYYFQEKRFINGLEVRNIIEFVEKLDQYSIVIGFCDVEKTKFLMNNQQLLKTSFYLLWEPYKAFEWNEEYLKQNHEMFKIIFEDLSDVHSKEILNQLMYAKLNVYGLEMLKIADNNQYFNELTFCLDSQKEVFVDCGAFNGDTILKYIKFTNGSYKKIFAFEPNQNNLKELKNKIKDFDNIEVIDKGTWEQEGFLAFEDNGSASHIVCNGKEKVPVIPIDAVVKDEKVTFIKMDVEGSELQSLQGAARTIAYNMPKLAICCYHKADDIVRIYQFIKEFDNDKIKYHFYLRHHSNSAYETVLYAIPGKNRENK